MAPRPFRPDVMRMQIDAAADHRVNVFLYDGYWFREECVKAVFGR